MDVKMYYSFLYSDLQINLLMKTPPADYKSGKIIK